MKANEFFKKHGIPLAEMIINDSPSWAKSYFLGVEEYEGSDFSQSYEDCISLNCLKRLVESHELVAIHGFEKSKEIVANAPSDDHFYSWTLGDSGVRDKTVNIGKLRKAIADVESCMEVSSESN